MSASSLTTPLRRLLRTTATAPSTSTPARRLFASTSTSTSSSSSSSSESTPTANRPPSRLAFAFDIDGVLKAGPTVLPQARRALALLHGHNRYGARVPYILLTNGGGVSEGDRAARLSSELGVRLSPGQVLQAHTVLQSLTRLYAREPILVVGGPEKPPGTTRSVMHGYGFQDVYTAHDLHAASPASWPFSTVPDDFGHTLRTGVDFNKVHFKAVIVFHDSHDWGRDIQLMTDILRSRDGVFGTLAEDAELKKRDQIPLYFTHGDLLWGNDFPVSRFGQGAFRAAFSQVWQRTTRLPFEFTVFGKPEKLTYEYAAELLGAQEAELLAASDGAPRSPSSQSSLASLGPLRVYMVGDNPASDIRGGRDFGWETALVRTGVYRDATGEPAYKPTLLVDDVEQAVRAAMEREWGEGVCDVA